MSPKLLNRNKETSTHTWVTCTENQDRGETSRNQLELPIFQVVILSPHIFDFIFFFVSYWLSRLDHIPST